MSSTSKCSFCGVRGHKISDCNHQFAGHIMETFNLKLVCNYDPSLYNFADRAHYVYLHLKTLSLKHLHVIAAKHGIPLSNHTKAVLVAKIMDLHYVDHPYPEWRDALPHPVNHLELDVMASLRRVIIATKSRVPLSNAIPENQLLAMNRNQLLQRIDIIRNEIEQIISRPSYSIDRKFPIQMTCKPISENADQYEVNECAICYENVTGHHMVQFNCKHEFCSGCVVNTLKTVKSRDMPTCAFCRAEVSSFETRDPAVMNKLEQFVR
jgi:hypothetical protein